MAARGRRPGRDRGAMASRRARRCRGPGPATPPAPRARRRGPRLRRPRRRRSASSGVSRLPLSCTTWRSCSSSSRCSSRFAGSEYSSSLCSSGTSRLAATRNAAAISARADAHRQAEELGAVADVQDVDQEEHHRARRWPRAAGRTRPLRPCVRLLLRDDALPSPGEQLANDGDARAEDEHRHQEDRAQDPADPSHAVLMCAPSPRSAGRRRRALPRRPATPPSPRERARCARGRSRRDRSASCWPRRKR